MSLLEDPMRRLNDRGKYQQLEDHDLNEFAGEDVGLLFDGSSASSGGGSHLLPNNDEEDMKRLGRTQHFKRNFSLFSTIGFTAILVATWEFILVATYSGLVNGGFGGLIYEYIWTWFGYSSIIISLAELSSMAPTAGGQYHWTSEFAPPQYQRILSYITGWTCCIAWQPALSSGLYPVAVMIKTIYQYYHPSSTLPNWQASVLMILLAFTTIPFNTVWRKSLPAFESIILVMHFAGFLITILALWVFAPKNSIEDVFTVVNSGGWSSTTLSMMIGQVSIFFCMVGFDSAAHLAEEIENASVNVPRSMMWAYCLNGAMGLAMLVTYCFCVGSLDSALDSPEPFIPLFLHGTGNAFGASCLTIILLVMLLAGNNTTLTTQSRQLWAFATDQGLPFSGWISRINPRWNVPLNAIGVTVTINILLCLINLGSNFAFNVIIGVQNSGFLATYIICIGCLLYRRLRGDTLPPARWSLGRAGTAINSFALAYACFLFVFVFFPMQTPVTLESMNWSVVIFVGVIVFSLMFYLVHGRFVYSGPVLNVESSTSFD